MRSKLIAFALLASIPAIAQDAGVQEWRAFNVDNGDLVSADNGVKYHVEGGLYIDEPSRSILRGVISSVRADNDDLRAKLDRANKRIIEDESQWTVPGWVPIVVGIVIAGAAAGTIAGVVKANQK